MGGAWCEVGSKSAEQKGGGANGTRNSRREPSGKVIIDFVLIDTDNPAIGYAIWKQEGG